MDNIENLSKEDFAMVLLLMALFPTKETEELFKEYAEKEKPTEV